MSLGVVWRVVVCGVVCVAALGLLGVGVASAQTFPATDTASLVTAVNDANATPGSNTITLAGNVTYLPTATLKFSTKTSMSRRSVKAASSTWRCA